MANLDLDLLIENGEITDEVSFEDLDEALRAYRDLYEALSRSAEMVRNTEGEAFDFNLAITSYPPYIITTQIYIV